ncbi:protein ZBED8-like [Homarus americanus]|uniref:protein ZBED8-like n=1 Tax=Homarus americanus TaxID=6706 RepID=UPI001C459AD9|nr:protein ZBED8-like [Homarus americanus]
MVELVYGLEQRKKIAAVPLSNDVIHSRIADITSNILKQVMEELAATPFPFSMQLDETTDVSQCSQLLVFVRYMHADAIKEEFLFCESRLETTKAIDILEMVNSFFAKQNFDWKKNLGTLCTDGAPAMLGNTSGFAALVKKEAPQVIVTHCFLHRHALASKTLPAILKEVLSTGVKVVNFIRARAVNHRVFKRFCQEMGAEYEVLLYHTEVRWLSRGQILKRLIELRAEVSLFLKEKESPLSQQFDSEEFIHGLAYLADIFGHMNEVNLAIQGPGVTFLDAAERLQAFLAKLPLWKRRLEADNYANFPMLEEVLLQDGIESDKALSISLQAEFCRHLDTLQNYFKGFFCSRFP